MSDTPEFESLIGNPKNQDQPRPFPARDPQADLAAVDLGSNSFHLVVARYRRGQLKILDRIREPVRLAEGLDSKGRLSLDVQARALGCLGRFGERLRGVSPDRVRAVGTNTLRKTSDGGSFLALASAELGHTIQVISGAEEARLIYQGVHRSTAEDIGPRLVIDIGGGSTELIVGQEKQIKVFDSLHMGCVSFSKRYFPEGRVSVEAFEKAKLHAGRELQPITEKYRHAWDTCLGASGTIKATQRLCAELYRDEDYRSERKAGSEWGGKDADNETDAIQIDALKTLVGAMVSAGGLQHRLFAELDPDRRRVYAGGLAVLSALFEQLEIREMRAVKGALREGLLFDLVGQFRDDDPRDISVRMMMERHEVDRRHATRVEKTALALFIKSAERWRLNDDDRKVLIWAARLHEIGLSVNHSGYHKHGEYLVRHSFMSGFTMEEQHRLALLVRTHRRKFRQEHFKPLIPELRGRTQRLAALLRLSVLFNRSRSATSKRQTPEIRVDDEGLAIEIKPAWQHKHPFSRANLLLEAAEWHEAGLRLQLLPVG